jgi:hypothetical protein
MMMMIMTTTMTKKATLIIIISVAIMTTLLSRVYVFIVDIYTNNFKKWLHFIKFLFFSKLS